MEINDGVETLQSLATLIDSLQPRSMTTQEVEVYFRRISAALRVVAAQDATLLEIVHVLEETQSKQLEQINELTQQVKTMQRQ